ncbi:MAG TPA: hypothetical protein VH349_16355 [Ktedonobacterales bacterium]|jgi:hypothetical protein
MSSEIILPGRIHRETEFVGGLHGACGPNAASMAERWADQSTLSTLDVYHRMRGKGLCDANGVTTMSRLVTDARAAGYRLDTLAYREPMPESVWRPWFLGHVGKEALVFETANGQVLRDLIGGKGENARNLHYHFLMVAGWHPGGASRVAGGRSLPSGWWCCDGDNFAAGDVLQFYDEATLAAARPVAAMAVSARVAMGGTKVIPNGWSDDGASLHAPNGISVVKGFRDSILAQHWDAEDWPLGPEYSSASVEPGNPAIGPGSRQDFRKGSLGWTEKMGVYRIWVGQDLLAYQHLLADARGQIAALQAQLDADPAEAAVKALAAALKAVG